MIPLPLDNLPDVLESSPKLLFSIRLRAQQAHKLDLFAMVNQLSYHNILEESSFL